MLSIYNKYTEVVGSIHHSEMRMGETFECELPTDSLMLRT